MVTPRVLYDYNQKPFAFYCNEKDTDSFIVGSIASVNADEVIMQLLSPEGKCDGLCYCTLRSVYRIEWDSQYLYALQKRSTLRKTPEKLIRQTSPWRCFLDYAFENKLKMQVRSTSYEHTHHGILASFTSDYIVIQAAGQSGNAVETLQIYRSDIILMTCELDSKQEVFDAHGWR